MSRVSAACVRVFCFSKRFCSCEVHFHIKRAWKEEDFVMARTSVAFYLLPRKQQTNVVRTSWCVYISNCQASTAPRIASAAARGRS